MTTSFTKGNSSNSSDWQQSQVQDVITRSFCGPSPDCEERVVRDANEWGVLKTTAITWNGWNPLAHKVLPKAHWNHPELEVKPGDVLVTKAGPRHRVGVVVEVDEIPPHIIASGKMIALRPNKNLVVPRILAAALSMPTPQKFIDHRSTGMAESQVNFFNEVLLSTALLLPPIEEQARIAKVLDALDGAIRATKGALEKMEKIRRGLVTDLLKTPTVGCIKTDWSVGPLGQWIVGRPKNGYSALEVDEPTGLFVLGLGCLSENGFVPTQLKPIKASRNSASAILNDGDLLISRSNTRDLVGLVGVYRDIGSPCTYPDLMMKLKPSVETTAEFLSLQLSSSMVRRQIQVLAMGTSGSMVKLSSKQVMGLSVVMPPPSDQEQILKTVKEIDRTIAFEKLELSKLSALKAGLSTDLLTSVVRTSPH